MKNYVYFSNESFLSNWYESDMEVDGIKFRCMWQYITYQKAILFGDYEITRLVRSVETSEELRYLNSKIRWFDSKVWADRRYAIVKRGVISKFSNNDELMRKLLRYPSDSIFVLCSPFDREWGCGLYIKDKDIHNEEKWRGLNLLGKILTEVRMELEGLYVE